MREHAAGRVAEPVTEPIPPVAPAGPVGPVGPPPPDPEPRRPRGWPMALRSQLAFAVVLVVVAVGVIRLGQYHWREGSVLIAGALLLAGLCRAVLPPRLAGLLVVRGRPIDVASYVVLAALMLFVALTLTGGPFG
jgi:hypothetical protein